MYQGGKSWLSELYYGCWPITNWVLRGFILRFVLFHISVSDLRVATLMVLADGTKLSEHAWEESSHPEGPAQAGGLGWQDLCEIQTDKEQYQMSLPLSMFVCLDNCTGTLGWVRIPVTLKLMTWAKPHARVDFICQDILFSCGVHILVFSSEPSQPLV